MAIKARDAIVSVAAILGSQVTAALLVGITPGQSSSCLQWASESISAAQQNLNYAVNPAPISESGYYDVRSHRDESVRELDANQSVAPSASPYAAAAAAGTEALPDRTATQSVSGSAEMSMIPDVTEADYQRARRAWTPGGAHE